MLFMLKYRACNEQSLQKGVLVNMIISFLDANNVRHEGKIVAVFHNNDNHYIAYTKKDNINNKIKILVGKYEPKENNTIRIYDVSSKEEWTFINKYLMNKINGGEINA